VSFLQPLEGFIIKVIQLYEMIVVRHGLMLVGWSSIKTSCIRVLAGALTDLHTKGQAGEHRVKLWTLNPKSVAMGQLYGEDDPIVSSGDKAPYPSEIPSFVET